MKTRIILCGICGAMGKTVLSICESNPDYKVVCGVDLKRSVLSVPVYNDFFFVHERANVLLDFSSPKNLRERLNYARKASLPVVSATTGFSESDKKLLREFSEELPLFLSSNFSLGIFVLKKLAFYASQLLPNASVEIIERHHKNKIDAPSGTAKELAGLFSNPPNVHSLRGGTVTGEHEIFITSEKENLSLIHRAESKELFALGALDACRFLRGKPKGLYGMEDLFQSKKNLLT